VPKTEKRCEHCGSRFIDASPAQRGRFCGRSCREKAARARRSTPTATHQPVRPAASRDAELQAALNTASEAELGRFLAKLPEGVTLDHLRRPVHELTFRASGLDEPTWTRLLDLRGYQPGDVLTAWLDALDAGLLDA
jgi:hypothetical protein